MEIKLFRTITKSSYTIGTLSIEEKGICFTLEDTFRHQKIQGETRIPQGRYKIKLRNEGGMTKRYARKFDFHKGMLWLQDVPGFKWVYIHYGNYAKNTDGCILVGSSANVKKEMIGSSIATYTEVYKLITEALKHEEVWIEIVDLA